MFMGYGDYEDMYNALIKGLEQADPYLCGTQFTVADVCLGAMLMWLLNLGEILTHPIIERYVTTLQQREVLQKSGLFQL